jgi:CDP-paratose 2-epimerase
MPTILITGSSGLVGSEAVEYFDHKGYTVIGVDNNMRQEFFGPGGNTNPNLERLFLSTSNFEYRDADVRDRIAIEGLFELHRPDYILHCAAQPSHDKSREIPLIDFEVNALGTMNVLEAMRIYTPKASMLFLSTNKVYGDAPNEQPFKELETRYDGDPIDETCRIDRSTHSPFGASKLSADVMAQEYGRYFGLNVGIFRCGCVTGPNHAGVELHGFLSYLVKCAASGDTYTVYGYKGKQVRDQIHSYDVVRAAEEFFKRPRPGEVYNIGGGRENSISVLEAIERVGKVKWEYSDKARTGDHICYISDTSKFRSHYPDWKLTYSLDRILEEMVAREACEAK